MPFAGFLVSEGRFDFALVLAATTAGSVISAVVWWGAGKLYGRNRLYRLIERYGRWVLLRPSDLERAEQFFARHGGKAVVFGRFVPGVRSLISLPAGLADMPVLRFALLTAFGSGLWNALLIGVGVVLRERWQERLGYLDAFGYFAYALLLGSVVWFAARRFRARRTEANDVDRGGGER